LVKASSVIFPRSVAQIKSVSLEVGAYSVSFIEPDQAVRQSKRGLPSSIILRDKEK
jgi:hypothetical protein